MFTFDTVKISASKVRVFARVGLVSVAIGVTGIMTAGCGAADGGEVAADDLAAEQQAPLAPLVTVRVTPSNPAIAVGTRQKFTATGIYADNTQRDVTRSVTWTSSNPSVAPIGNIGILKGVARGLGAGATNIVAQLDYVSVSTILTVVAR